MLVTTYLSWRGRRWHGELPAGSVVELVDVPGRGADADTSHDVRRALATLSPQQRAVVVLRYFADLTEAGTAEVMGCSVGSVKTHHSRALARLRDSHLIEKVLP